VEWESDSEIKKEREIAYGSIRSMGRQFYTLAFFDYFYCFSALGPEGFGN
jgi:hypothetical protein